MTGISSNMIAAIWRGVKVVITTKQLWVQILLVACERFAMVKISNNCPVEYKAKRLLYVIIGQKKLHHHHHSSVLNYRGGLFS